MNFTERPDIEAWLNHMPAFAIYRELPFDMKVGIDESIDYWWGRRGNQQPISERRRRRAYYRLLFRSHQFRTWKDITADWEPRPPGPQPGTGRIQGQLRVAADGRSFVHAGNQDIVPTVKHTGDVLALWYMGEIDKAKDILTEIAKHYDAVDLWFILNPRNDPDDWWGSTHIYPKTPAQFDRVKACLQFCKDLNLKIGLAAGGLAGVDDAAETRLYGGMRDIMQDLGSEAFWRFEYLNEAPFTGDRDDDDPAEGERLVQPIRDAFPELLVSLTAHLEKERHLLERWVRPWMKFYTYESWREGDWCAKVRHPFTFGYPPEGRPVRPIGINGEGCGVNLPPFSYRSGPGTWVSSTDNIHELYHNRYVMPLVAANCAIGGQIRVTFNSSSIVSDADLYDFPGFVTEPAMIRRLPNGIHRATRIHGGDVWRGDRIFVAPEGGRCDHAILPNGEFVVTMYWKGGDKTIQVERDCDFTLVDPDDVTDVGIFGHVSDIRVPGHRVAVGRLR
jgi:hypothetical protein